MCHCTPGKKTPCCGPPCCGNVHGCAFCSPVLKEIRERQKVAPAVPLVSERERLLERIARLAASFLDSTHLDEIPSDVIEDELRDALKEAGVKHVRKRNL